MLSTALLAAALAIAANAHYTFPSIQSSGDWESVRRADNWQDNGFVGDVTSPQMACFQSTFEPAGDVATVEAGSSVTYHANPNVYHPGPMQFYMAKLPEGETFDTFDATSGDVWFKIYQDQPDFGDQLTWPSDAQSSFDVSIPACIAPGDYLLRAEHIALHTAQSVGGAQFYISCAQLTVTGGGSTEPSAKASFPGAYSATDPGIQINVNYPVPTSYENPGPELFSC